MDEAHRQVLTPSHDQSQLTSLLATNCKKKPQNPFNLFLECLHRYALSHFFPSGYATESLESMSEKLYQQQGFLKKKQHCWEISLRPFEQKNLQKDVQIACERFNQSDIRLADQKQLRIYLQSA